jgi:hypothetical protein
VFIRILNWGKSIVFNLVIPQMSAAGIALAVSLCVLVMLLYTQNLSGKEMFGRFVAKFSCQEFAANCRDPKTKPQNSPCLLDALVRGYWLQPKKNCSQGHLW